MSRKKNTLTTIGIFFWCSTLIFVLLPSWPHLFYRLHPQTSAVLAGTIADTALEAHESIISPPPPDSVSPSLPPVPTLTPYLPEIDPTLPTENGLIIDKIGVRGEIHEGSDVDRILRTGIWRVPDFGTPPESLQPVIIAAHRWGYLDWSASFRKLNSFYNLPKLGVGDTIKIIWDQRQYEYKIYAVETGTKITDYNAKLILYTCQLWNSPLRFFVYANPI